MKVIMLVSRSGADGSYSPGDEVEVSSAEGARMIEAGQAQPVRAAVSEKATKRPATEKAAK